MYLIEIRKITLTLIHPISICKNYIGIINLQYMQTKIFTPFVRKYKNTYVYICRKQKSNY